MLICGGCQQTPSSRSVASPPAGHYPVRQISVSLRHRKVRRTGGRSVRSRHLNLASDRAGRNRSRNLRIVVDGENRCLHPTEGDFRRAGEAVSTNRYMLSYRSAGRAEADDHGSDAEYGVAGQFASGRGDGYRTPNRVGRNCRRQIGVGNNGEGRCGSIEGNGRRSCQSLAEDADGLSNLAIVGQQFHERPQPHGHAKDRGAGAVRGTVAQL